MRLINNNYVKKQAREAVRNGGIITMRKKKGNLLQRTMVVLLSVVLAAGMALDAYPLTALAQENAGGGITRQRKASAGIR